MDSDATKRENAELGAIFSGKSNYVVSGSYFSCIPGIAQATPTHLPQATAQPNNCCHKSKQPFCEDKYSGFNEFHSIQLGISHPVHLLLVPFTMELSFLQMALLDPIGRFGILSFHGMGYFH
jgi:hypothetical protein